MTEITGPVADDPEALEHRIRDTRANLDSKMDELQRRLDPRVRAEALKQDLRARWSTGAYQGWVAAGAIAAGVWMTVAGLRRARGAHVTRDLDDPACVDVLLA
jgi:hypothetical protein